MGTFIIAACTFVFAFFIATTLIICHNSYYFLGLNPDKDNFPQDSENEQNNPDISILIPARNEERNILKLLNSIDGQNYPGSMEILVLDDHSSDNTSELVHDFSRTSGFSVRLLKGKEKPGDWLGKNWACHQLAGSANGDILVFLDADTWTDTGFINEIVIRMRRFRLDFLTVWPHQIMNSATEKSVISTVYATIVMYLPTLYCFQAPRWIPTQYLKSKVKPMFASACGQCMVFSRSCYDAVGGHASVKQEVVEDVKLAKKVVSSGKTMRMFHGTEKIWCRMYQSNNEVFEGFRKNFLAGFNYNIPAFVLAWIMHIIVYILPPAILLAGVAGLHSDLHMTTFAGPAAFLTAVPALQRLWITGFLKWPQSAGWLYLAGIFWFQVLALTVVFDYFTGKQNFWKGRSV